MAEGDEFIDISKLGPRTSISLTDIVHIRSTGGIDSKMTVADFLKLISTDNIQELTLNSGVTIEQILLKDNTITASIGNIATNNVTIQNMTGTMKWKKFYENAGVTEGTIYDNISSWLTATNKSMRVMAGGSRAGVDYYIVGILRTSGTQIDLIAFNLVGNPTVLTITSAGGTVWTDFQIMSNGNEF